MNDGHPDSDRAALHGKDPIERASNYARYIISRDRPDSECGAAICVFEVGEGQNAVVSYAASDLDLTRVQVEGMLYDSLRAIALVLSEAMPSLPPKRRLTFKERLARRLLE